MATRIKPKGAATPDLAVDGVSRRPQQDRSKASLERMLVATERLMLERGSEDFTLQEVSQAGNVSIGSIYLRFESKDNLIRAVIAHELDRLSVAEERAIAKAIKASATLGMFVPAYVDAYAELLRYHAPLLRLIMQRAANDPLVAEPGRESAYRSAEGGKSALLRYRDEFGGMNPARHAEKAEAAYQVIFATLARELSLGLASEAVTRQDWTTLKTELGRMCLAYLRDPA